MKSTPCCPRTSSNFVIVDASGSMQDSLLRFVRSFSTLVAFRFLLPHPLAFFHRRLSLHVRSLDNTQLAGYTLLR